MLRLVLDTNVWLDWLVFDDPAIRPLREAHAQGRAEIFIDEACEAELIRVLAYEMGKWSLDAARQSACLEQCRRVASRITDAAPEARLPQCRDPDDQKFLVAALASRASVLVTKDQELLRLSGLPFRIVAPAQLQL